jgi:hypothetical protein
VLPIRYHTSLDTHSSSQTHDVTVVGPLTGFQTLVSPNIAAQPFTGLSVNSFHRSVVSNVAKLRHRCRSLWRCTRGINLLLDAYVAPSIVYCSASPACHDRCLRSPSAAHRCPPCSMSAIIARDVSSSTLARYRNTQLH